MIVQPHFAFSSSIISFFTVVETSFFSHELIMMMFQIEYAREKRELSESD